MLLIRSIFLEEGGIKLGGRESKNWRLGGGGGMEKIDEKRHHLQNFPCVTESLNK